LFEPHQGREYVSTVSFVSYQVEIFASDW
jgi:hypothetical protein